MSKTTTTLTKGNIMSTVIEHTGANEQAVRSARRALIAAGVAVSLLSFDNIRNLFVFDEIRFSA
jgi:hypothetical protein